MQLLYNIAAILIGVLIIPVFMVRAVREKGFVERIRQSLGFFPKHALDKVEKKDCICSAIKTVTSGHALPTLNRTDD